MARSGLRSGRARADRTAIDQAIATGIGRRRPALRSLAMLAATRRASSRVRIGSPSQQHDPIRILGPTVTMGWSPMRLTRRCLKCLVGDFVEDRVVSLAEFGSDVAAVIHGD